MNAKTMIRSHTFWFVALTTLIIVVVLYSFHTGSDMAERYTPLVSAARDIKIEATTAHLWLEEIIAGDTYLKIDDVWKNLDTAERHAQMMLKGGDTPAGKLLPLEESALRIKAEQALAGIKDLRGIAQERWSMRSQAGVGSDIDQRFDGIFITFLAQIDEVISALQKTMTEDLRHYHLLQILLITIIGILAIFISVLLRRNQQRHWRDIHSLQEREQNLAITLNSIGDAVITTDAEGNVTSMNPVAERLTGWSLKEARKRPLQTIFPIIDASTRKPMSNPVEIVIDTGETVHLSNHTTLISRDDTEYQIADSAAPICDEEGHIFGMVLVFNDVTEQYQLRQAAAANQKKYQTLATVSPVGIFHTDAQGQCLYVNEKWREITGISSADAMGDGWTKNIHPEDRPLVFAEWKKSTEQGKTFKMEYRFQQADGVRWVFGQAHADETKDGEIIGYVGSLTDITDRKEAEETLAKSSLEWDFAMDFFEDAIYLIDLDNKLVRANRAFYRMTGLTPELAVGRDITSIFHPEGEAVPCPVCRARRDRHDEIITMEADHPDNPVGNPIQITVQIIRDNAGAPLSILMGVRDLSKIREAEQEKAYLQHQLHQSQKMDALGKLTGGIAHDYNNMLGVIMGYSELLMGALDDQPKLAEYARKIHHAGDRGARLTQKLLAFSRYKATEADCLDLNSLLQNEQHMLEKTLTVRIKLILDLAEDLWPVWLDDNDMEDVVLNMSINAAHAMEGHGQLNIRTSNEHLDQIDAQALNLAPGDYVLFSITDTGCGMDEETKAKIFEPFFSTKGEQGTGLGLSQVYGFMEHSGGAIKLYSELGHGTRIALYFPRYLETDDKEPSAEEDNVVNIKGSETILVVDDEPALLSLSSEILSQHGFNVITAETAEKALDILEHETVDLLISDIIMPEMNGHQLAAIVKQKYPTVKIQLASGFASDNNASLVDEKLQQNLLFKPFSSQALLHKIHELLNEK